MNYLMALDAGTGAGRCFMVSEDGQHTIETYQEWTYQFPAEAQPGGAEFDPAMTWKLFSELIRRALTENGITPEQVLAVSSTSAREGMVFLDRNGNELYAGPNIDQRAPSNHAAFTAEFGERLHANSGHWPFPMFAPYRLLWFKEHRPDIYARIDRVMMVNDWLLYRLCGQAATEPSNGNETLLFDLFTRDWANETIQATGFNASIFASVLESGSVLGEVTQQAASQTGLAMGTPVVMGGADTQSALLGMGAVHAGDVGIVMGTYGPLQLVLDEPMVVAPELAWSGCHVMADKWVLESTSMEVGQAFRWIRDVFYCQDHVDSYALMEAEAAATPPGSNGVLAFNGPRMPNYRELRFTGPGGFRTQLPPQPASSNRGVFARATLESVAYAVHANARRLERISGQKVDNLRACGGLSKSATLIQIMADLLAVPVRVPRLKEGSALGAAICAGVGIGAYRDVHEGVQALVSWEREVQPDSNSTGFYEERFAEWQEQVPAMYGTDALTE